MATTPTPTPELDDLPFQPRRKICDDGGCWRWIGATTGDGNPSVRQGSSVRSARRVVRETLGFPPVALSLYPACNLRSCVHPAHLVPMTHSQIQLRVDRPPALRSAQISRGMRAAGRLRIADDVVRDIVFGSDSAQEASDRHQVSLSYVYQLRRGRMRRDLTAGPLHGLVSSLTAPANPPTHPRSRR